MIIAHGAGKGKRNRRGSTYGMVNGGRIPEPSTGLGVPWRVGRRCRYTPPTAANVGAGIPDGPGRQCYAGASRMPRPTDGWYKKAAVRHPLTGWGRRPCGIRRRDCAICGWRFGTLGCFARCGERVFRAVRGAGVSPVATGGYFAPCAGRPELCLWTPRFFEKNRVKLLMFRHHCGSDRPGIPDE